MTVNRKRMKKMKVNKKQIAYNRAKRTQRPQYIVIHDTGNTGKGANAESHFRYFNGGNRNASADFFVDDTQVLQVNDYMTYYTWHCGDGKGRYGITNSNSLGIEICINSDGDYNTAFDNAVWLTKQLMDELNIPITLENRFTELVTVGVEISYHPETETREELITNAENMKHIFLYAPLAVKNRFLSVNEITFDADKSALIAYFELEYLQETETSEETHLKMENLNERMVTESYGTSSNTD